MKKLSFLLVLFAPFFLFGQGLVNNGAQIVVTTGAEIYIDGGTNGNYKNTDGLIDLNGVISVEGDFTNNSSTNNHVFKNVGTDGEVVFAGGTQNITTSQADLTDYIDFEKVTINSGSNTTLASTTAPSAMTVNGVFTVNGTFTSETPSNEGIGGSLITSTGTNGTGTINIKRFFKLNERWQYISSPMTDQSTDEFTDAGGGYTNPNFYYYNEAFDQTALADPTNTDYNNYLYTSGYNFSDAWETGPATFATTVGYICYHNTNITKTFTGTPDKLNDNAEYNASVSYTLNDNPIGAGDFYDGWNLIGNPYQSAINWKVIVDQNSSDFNNIAGTVYMWNGDAGGTFTGNYIYYNYSGTLIQGTNQTLNSDANAQYIPAMQSFFVKATAASPILTIPASARVHNNNQMYKSSNDEIPDFDFIKLQVNYDGKNDQTLVRFFEGATENIDDEFDAYKMFATTEGLPQVYSLVNNDGAITPVAINSLPIDEYVVYKEIPLGIVAKEAGEYQFTAAELNTKYFEKIYLVEKVNEQEFVYTDLDLTPSYNVHLEAGEFRDKFYLLGTNSATDIENLNKSSQVNIYSHQNRVFVCFNDLDFLKGNIEIYDILGKNVFSEKVHNTYNEYILNVSAGTYIVKYILNDKIFVKKISIY